MAVGAISGLSHFTIFICIPIRLAQRESGLSPKINQSANQTIFP
jgi:hypothetical protein